MIPKELRELIGGKFVTYIKNLLENETHFIIEQEFLEELDALFEGYVVLTKEQAEKLVAINVKDNYWAYRSYDTEEEIIEIIKPQFDQILAEVLGEEKK